MTGDEFNAMDDRLRNARRLFLCQKKLRDCREDILGCEGVCQIAGAMRSMSESLELHASTALLDAPVLRSPKMIGELKEAIAAILAKYADKFRREFDES